ncbi:MAG: hypothetical protein CHACPFDD_02878 [Phycisphaerae bacterium]|nr:hypothetical protein [Phycisphaerae bacterium]
MIRRTLLTPVVCVALASAAYADPTITGAALSTWAADGTGTPAFSNDTFSSGPLNFTRHVADGESSVSADYDLGEMAFHFDFAQYRAGHRFSSAGASGAVTFTLASAADYVLSGALELLGDQVVYQSVSLYDLTADTTLFTNYQYSDHTFDENFSLGHVGGDYGNGLYGSDVGTLEGGHEYGLYYTYVIYGPHRIDQGASGTGSLKLELSRNPNPTPAPGAALLAAIGLGFLRRRRL